jgi:hypothetical protein
MTDDFYNTGNGDGDENSGNNSAGGSDEDLDELDALENELDDLMDEDGEEGDEAGDYVEPGKGNLTVDVASALTARMDPLPADSVSETTSPCY